MKSLTLQRIYKNNYTKHCINKIYFAGEEIEDENTERGTKINMCAILLEYENDPEDVETNNNFFEILVSNYNKHFDRVANPKKRKAASQNQEEYDIHVNYGVTSLNKNRELKVLFEKYLEEKNIKINPNEKSKLFLIINDTKETFTFRWFKDGALLEDYFTNLDNSDFLEDISLGFDFFANYGIREIREIFVDEKVFSFEKIIMNAIYAQKQAAYIFSFLLIFIASQTILKIQYLIFFAIGISIFVNLVWQLYISLNI